MFDKNIAFVHHHLYDDIFSTRYYYLAMAEDIILRLLWVLGLVLKQVQYHFEDSASWIQGREKYFLSLVNFQTTGLPHELIGSVQQVAEVFRRSSSHSLIDVTPFSIIFYQ